MTTTIAMIAGSTMKMAAFSASNRIARTASSLRLFANTASLVMSSLMPQRVHASGAGALIRIRSARPTMWCLRAMTANVSEATPYTLLGGRDGVTRLAERFYEIMDGQSAAAGIRAMHGADLGPVRESLAGFLCGYLGGPRDWFMQPGRPCIMSLHRALPIGEAERDQWIGCMKLALEECVVDSALRDEILSALFRTASAMRSR
jgi:hemoglobin